MYIQCNCLLRCCCSEEQVAGATSAGSPRFVGLLSADLRCQLSSVARVPKWQPRLLQILGRSVQDFVKKIVANVQNYLLIYRANRTNWLLALIYLYYNIITNNNFTELQLEFPKDSVLELTLYEASNDLLTHPDFSIPERPKNSIPMPFVLNDAILTIKTLRFE